MASEIKMPTVKRWQTWYTLLAFVYMYLPIGVLTIFSVNKSPSPSRWTGFTWEWYAKFLQNPILLAALKNSLSIALTAVAVSAVLGTLTAVGLARYYFPGKGLYRGVTYLPLIMPDIAIAVATLVFFAAIKFGKTAWIALIAPTTCSLKSSMTLSSVSRLNGFNTIAPGQYTNP